MCASRISTGIDLSADGKQIGYAQLPYSVDNSAYGWIPIPIASIKNGVGKTVLVTAGTHGDEYEGQIAITRLIKEISSEEVVGQVIFVPMTNFPAAKAGKRVSPLDGGNLNRLYPGDANGTPTQMIAHFIETVLMTKADLVLDLHSGGQSLNYLPSTSLLSEKDDDKEERRTLARLFGAPYCMEWVGNGGIGSSADAAARQGIIRLGTELGGCARIDPSYRQLCEHGVRRVLRYQGILPNDETPDPGHVQMVSVTKTGYVFADCQGLFEPAVRLGETVTTGQVAGYIYDPSRPGSTPHAQYFRDSGLVLCERPMAKCDVGDCLFHLGTI